MTLGMDDVYALSLHSSRHSTVTPAAWVFRIKTSCKLRQQVGFYRGEARLLEVYLFLVLVEFVCGWSCYCKRSTDLHYYSLQTSTLVQLTQPSSNIVANVSCANAPSLRWRCTQRAHFRYGDTVFVLVRPKHRHHMLLRYHHPHSTLSGTISCNILFFFHCFLPYFIFLYTVAIVIELPTHLWHGSIALLRTCRTIRPWDKEARCEWQQAWKCIAVSAFCCKQVPHRIQLPYLSCSTPSLTICLPLHPLHDGHTLLHTKSQHATSIYNLTAKQFADTSTARQQHPTSLKLA